jgi:hypothetical protein
MYQSLIYRFGAERRRQILPSGGLEQADEARGLAPASNSEGADGAADALIDGVTGDAELRGNLFRAEMTIDETEHFKLSAAQTSKAF